MSGAPAQRNDLGVRREVADGFDEVGDALLAGDAADEEDVGLGGVDAVFYEGGGAGGLLVFGEVDAVVDDVDAGGIDVGIGAEDVGLGALRDGDDGVGIEDGGLLHPTAHGVAAAELLGLPGAEGFERVRGEHEGDVEQLLGEEAGHRDIPGVGVDDVDAGERVDLGEVEAEGFECGFEFFGWALGDEVPRLGSADVEVGFVGVLSAPAMDFDFDLFGEFAAEVFNVDSGSAVYVGRVLACHEGCSQWCSPVGGSR